MHLRTTRDAEPESNPQGHDQRAQGPVTGQHRGGRCYQGGQRQGGHGGSRGYEGHEGEVVEDQGKGAEDSNHFRDGEDTILDFLSLGRAGCDLARG